MDDAAWGALALALMAGGGFWTWYALQHRGLASALRGAGLTLLVPAAYLTGTLELAGEVASSAVDWAAGFVFSPAVWVGLVLAGVAALLFGASGWMTARGKGGAIPGEKRTTDKRALPAAGPRAGAPAIDDDLAEIEAILKKRGIS